MDHVTAGSTLPEVIAAQVRRLQHRPLLTMYDDVTGARTELSYATADNWANKTANLLVEEFALAAGDHVAFDVDGHWSAVVLAMACWKIGAAPQPDGTRRPAALVCCHEGRVRDHPSGPLLVVGDGIRAEPVGDVDHRDGLVLLGEDVHAFADDYDGPAGDPAAPAIVSDAVTLPQRDVVARVDARRDALGERPRVAVAGPIDRVDALLGLAGVLLAGGSVVAERPGGVPPRWERLASEHITAVAGPASALVGAPDGVTAIDLGGADGR